MADVIDLTYWMSHVQVPSEARTYDDARKIYVVFVPLGVYWVLKKNMFTIENST